MLERYERRRKLGTVHDRRSPGSPPSTTSQPHGHHHDHGRPHHPVEQRFLHWRHRGLARLRESRALFRKILPLLREHETHLILALLGILSFAFLLASVRVGTLGLYTVVEGIFSRAGTAIGVFDRLSSGAGPSPETGVANASAPSPGIGSAPGAASASSPGP